MPVDVTVDTTDLASLVVTVIDVLVLMGSESVNVDVPLLTVAGATVLYALR